MTVWHNRVPAADVLPAALLIIAVGAAIAVLPVTYGALLVVGSIVVVTTLVWPQAGVVLIVPAIPFGSLRQVSVGVVNVGVTEALVLLVLFAWFFRLVVRRRLQPRPAPLALPLLFFLGALLLSALGASSLQHSAKEIIKWVEVLALYLFVVLEADETWRKILVFAVLGTGAIAAMLGIYQFLYRVGPEAFVLFDRFMRAYGTFEQPNPYAGYLGLTLPVAVGLVAGCLFRVGGPVNKGWLVWSVGTGGLMLIALLMSWSRGAWLGFAAALAMMGLAVVARSGRAAVIIVLLACVVAYLVLSGGLAQVPSSLAQRFSDFVPYLNATDVRGLEVTDANYAVLERLAHWQTALAMWTDHPLLGVGAGNYDVAYAGYALPLWPMPLGHAHNYYLNIAAEAGLLGLLAYFLLICGALVTVGRQVWRASGWQWAVALGVLGVLVHLIVHSLFDNLYVHGMYLGVAILLGVTASNGRQ